MNDVQEVYKLKFSISELASVRYIIKRLWKKPNIGLS